MAKKTNEWVKKLWSKDFGEYNQDKNEKEINEHG